MSGPRTVESVAASICILAFCDASVQLERGRVATLLREDMATTGAGIPSDEDLEQLVLGGDDGVPPASLRSLYPRLDELLEVQYGGGA